MDHEKHEPNFGSRSIPFERKHQTIHSQPSHLERALAIKDVRPMMAKGGMGQQDAPAKLPADALAPLHHAAAARVLALQGHHRMGALQTRKLLDLLASPAASTSYGEKHRHPRIPLWRNQDEQDAEELAQRSRREVDAAPQLVPDATLDEMMPRYYNEHNRHCGACQAPLIPMYTGETVWSREGKAIRCHVCKTSNRVSEPEAASRRSLRSLAMRQRQAEETPVAKRPSAAPVSAREDRDSFASTTATLRKEAPTALTLDERMRQKVKRRKANEAQLEPTQPTSSANLPGDTASESPALPQPQSSSLAAIDPFAGDRVDLTSRDDHKTLAKKDKSAKKPVSLEKAALRQLLSQNRANRQSTSTATPATSGLQSFLGSL